MQAEEVKRPFLIRVLMPILRFAVMYGIGPIGKSLMVISYPDPATGKKQHSMPIGYQLFGRDAVAVAAGENISWYHMLENMPAVTIYKQGGKKKVNVEFVSDPDQIAIVLDSFKKLYAGRYERFLGVPSDMPSAEAARSVKLSASFVRFSPLEEAPAS